MQDMIIIEADPFSCLLSSLPAMYHLYIDDALEVVYRLPRWVPSLRPPIHRLNGHQMRAALRPKESDGQ